MYLVRCVAKDRKNSELLVHTIFLKVLRFITIKYIFVPNKQLMKHVKLIMIAFLAVATLTACKNDDDGVDLTLDTDGDGIPDVDDLCPNQVGTIEDDGCYLVTNVNLDGTHDLTFLESDGTISANVAGVPVTGTISIVGDTFQTTVEFREDGVYVINGQYRIVSTIMLGGEIIEDSEILSFDNETGAYTTDANAETITFTGTDGIDGTWDVVTFTQGQLIITNVSTETTDDGAEVELTSEIRLMRQ